MHSEHINPQIFIENRKRFTAAMEKKSIAIFNSNDEIPSNGDSLYPYKQNTDLYSPIILIKNTEKYWCW
jgi:Xaa-Pro aminopeptidase